MVHAQEARPIMPKPKTLTYPEAAEALGVTPTRVGQLVRAGRLPGAGYDAETGRRLVERAAVLRRKRRPPKAGRPPKRA